MLNGFVALVVFAEAHLALSPSLGHADVVHHEQVDVDVVGAGAADLLVVCETEGEKRRKVRDRSHFVKRRFLYFACARKRFSCFPAKQKKNPEIFCFTIIAMFCT